MSSVTLAARRATCHRSPRAERGEEGKWEARSLERRAQTALHLRVWAEEGHLRRRWERIGAQRNAELPGQCLRVPRFHVPAGTKPRLKCQLRISRQTRTPLRDLWAGNPGACLGEVRGCRAFLSGGGIWRRSLVPSELAFPFVGGPCQAESGIYGPRGGPVSPPVFPEGAAGKRALPGVGAVPQWRWPVRLAQQPVDRPGGQRSGL